MDLSYCVVNTNGRELLLACLSAIARTTPSGLRHEVLVLDNASEDGSAEAVRREHPDVRLVRLERRAGKAENDSTLLEAARGRYCLLLNEDAELCEGAVAALVASLDDDLVAGAAGAQLLDPAGRPQPCAWRLPGLATALAGAVFLHRRLTVQSTGTAVRPVGWVQSSAMLVRRSAVADVGFLDPAFFVYSDETDLCRRLWDRGWRILWVPGARAVHHEGLSTDLVAARPRITEFHRNRDRYVRKHEGQAVAAVVRVLTAWAYALRAAAALAPGGRDPRRMWLHARRALRPGSGEGLREAAARWNRARDQTAARV